MCLVHAHVAFAQEDRFQYSVERGDTCYGLAKRFLGEARRCREIIAANPGLPPARIVHPGALIWIPGRSGEDSGPDATLTEVVQRVEKQEPDVTEWQRASRGDGVSRGWRVHTGTRSAAELMFRDRSRLTMRSDTLVVIYGATQNATRRQRSSTLRVVRGNLRSAVEQLRGTRIETPGAEVNLASGVAITAVDDEGTARLSNLEGRPATLRSSTGGSVRVGEGFGSAARQGERPTRPRPLPPAPRWSEETSRHVGLLGLGATVRLTWEPVDVARSYRVEVFSEEGTLVASAESDREVREAELHGFPEGAFVARVSTIDREFFEGRPSERHRFQVVVARLIDSEGDDLHDASEAPDPTSMPTAPTVVAGSTFVSPDGEQCRLEDDAPADALTFDRIGPAVVHCSSSHPLPFRILAPRIEAVEHDATADDTAVVEFRSLDGVMPENVTIETEVTDVRTERNAETLRVFVRRSDPSMRQVSVKIIAGADGDPLATSVVRFADAPPPPPPEAPTKPARAGFGPMDSIVTPAYLGLTSSDHGLSAGLTVNYLGRPGRDEDAGRSTIGVRADFRPLHLAARVALNPGELDSRAVGDTEILRLETGIYLVDKPEVEVTSRWDISLGFEDEVTARLLPSIQVLWRPEPTFAISTRQGASFVEDGSFEAWASAYGVSLRPVDWLEFGAEAHLVLGRATLAAMFGGGNRNFTAFAAGAFASVWLGPLNLFGSGRASLEPDDLSVGGPVLFTFGVRFVPGRDE